MRGGRGASESIAPGENGEGKPEAEAGAGVRCVLPLPGTGNARLLARWGRARFLSGAAEGLHFRAVIQVDV